MNYKEALERIKALLPRTLEMTICLNALERMIEEAETIPNLKDIIYCLYNGIELTEDDVALCNEITYELIEGVRWQDQNI